MITFATSPVIELPTSIKMIEERMKVDQSLTLPKVLGYSLAGAFDAASFGIVRNFVKLPTILMSEERSLSYSKSVDEHINAGAFTDKLFEWWVRAFD